MTDEPRPCAPPLHTFVGDEDGPAPWCLCGKVRNKWYDRTLPQVLLGLPRRPHNRRPEA